MIAMKPSVLFIVASDPRISARPAEAIRIAAGIGTWKRTDVSLYFRDAAVLALAEHTDEWVDDENFSLYLPILAELNRPFYVQQHAPAVGQLGNSRYTVQELSDTELAALTAGHTYVARF